MLCHCSPVPSSGRKNTLLDGASLQGATIQESLLPDTALPFVCWLHQRRGSSLVYPAVKAARSLFHPQPLPTLLPTYSWPTSIPTLLSTYLWPISLNSHCHLLTYLVGLLSPTSQHHSFALFSCWWQVRRGATGEDRCGGVPQSTP